MAISLMTRTLETSSTADAILLIEEPESHLHPKAIHQLKDVLDALKQDRQIIVSTHCPVLVNRANVAANIIVSKSKAHPANSLDELRNVLGVRISDNLRHAALVIVVEGSEDSVALSALFSAYSSKLRTAIRSGSVAFESIGGASKLRFALSQLKIGLCNYFVILDDDAEGRRSFGEAEKDSLASHANTSFIKCLGLPESELEDLYAEDLYAPYFRNKYAVDVRHAPFNAKKKWSDRIGHGLARSGKSSPMGNAWTDLDRMTDKRAIAELAAASPETAILPARKEILTAIINSVEHTLDGVSP